MTIKKASCISALPGFNQDTIVPGSTAFSLPTAISWYGNRIHLYRAPTIQEKESFAHCAVNLIFVEKSSNVLSRISMQAFRLSLSKFSLTKNVMTYFVVPLNFSSNICLGE